MPPKPAATKYKNKGGSVQTVAFKTQMEYAPCGPESLVDTQAAIPSQNVKPQPNAKFGFADDGGRYELLLSAICRGRINLTKTLMSILPPLSARDAVSPDGENSLMIAMQAIEENRRRKRMIDLLILHGASVKYINPNTGESLIHYCCKIPNRLIDLKFFINRWPVQMDIAKTDFLGNNALHCAVAVGEFQIVIYLLKLAQKSFMDLDQPNFEKLTPYLLAHKLGLFEIAEIIDQTAAEGLPALDPYLTRSGKKDNESRRSARDENDISFPALVSHTLPSRFDGFQMPIRTRTAIRQEGMEERLTKSLNETMRRREGLLIGGQPEHLPRVKLPSAIIRRTREELQKNSQSLHNLDDALALLPDYAITQEQKQNPFTTGVRPVRAGTLQKNYRPI